METGAAALGADTAVSWPRYSARPAVERVSRYLAVTAPAWGPAVVWMLFRSQAVLVIFASTAVCQVLAEVVLFSHFSSKNAGLFKTRAARPPRAPLRRKKYASISRRLDSFSRSSISETKVLISSSGASTMASSSLTWASKS